jgi:hypothetical protein
MERRGNGHGINNLGGISLGSSPELKVNQVTKGGAVASGFCANCGRNGGVNNYLRNRDVGIIVQIRSSGEILRSIRTINSGGRLVVRVDRRSRWVGDDGGVINNPSNVGICKSANGLCQSIVGID